MPRKYKFDYTPRVEAKAYCPRCKVKCFYEVGKKHYNWCGEILVPYAPVSQR